MSRHFKAIEDQIEREDDRRLALALAVLLTLGIGLVAGAAYMGVRLGTKSACVSSGSADNGR